MTDIKDLEEAIKLVVKYQLEELTLSDGTKIVKKLYLGKPIPKKKEINLPVTTYNKEDALYLATPAPELPLAMFNRYGTNLKG